MKQLRIVLLLLMVAMLFPAALWAQEATDSIDLEEALAIVREAYPDADIMDIGFDDMHACWEFEFADGTQVCVDEVTGEILIFTPGTDDEDVSDDGEVTDPAEDNGDVTDPAEDEGDVTSPEEDDGEVSDPAEDNGDVTDPAEDEGDVTSPEEDDGEVSDPAEDNGDVTDPAEDEGDVTSPEEDDGEVSDPAEDNGEVSVDQTDPPVVSIEAAIEIALTAFPNRAVTRVSLRTLDADTDILEIELDEDISVEVDAETGEIVDVVEGNTDEGAVAADDPAQGDGSLDDPAQGDGSLDDPAEGDGSLDDPAEGDGSTDVGTDDGAGVGAPGGSGTDDGTAVGAGGGPPPDGPPGDN